MTIGILVVAITALLPCASTFLIAEWLVSQKPRAFLAACPQRGPQEVSCLCQASLHSCIIAHTAWQTCCLMSLRVGRLYLPPYGALARRLHHRPTKLLGCAGPRSHWKCHGAFGSPHCWAQVAIKGRVVGSSQSPAPVCERFWASL